MALVDKRLRVGAGTSSVQNDGQTLSAFVSDWWLCTFYAPPVPHADPQGEVAHALQQQLEAACLNDSCAWLASEILQDSTIEVTLRAYGGEVLVQNQGTRWDSNREIDWLCTSRVLDVLVPTCAQFHFSDHKALEARVPIRATECEQGFLTPAVSWEKPKEASSEQWRVWLAEAWNSSDEVLDRLLPVQESWDMYMQLLHGMFSKALATYRSQGLPEDSHRCRPRHKLARLYERRRWQGGTRERREAARAEATTLCLKLGLSPDPFCAFVKDQVAELIPSFPT